MTVANSMRALHRSAENKTSEQIKKGDLYTVDLDLLEVEEGFNVGRDSKDPDVIQHIRNLADAYKAGDQLPALKVFVQDGRIKIRDGHCRRAGALLARSEGADIQRLPVEEVKGDEVDQTLILITSNEGLKQKPLGVAKIYAKLVSYGLTVDEIAKKIHKTPMNVQQYLDLNNLPVKMKNFISDGVIAWSTAVLLYAEHGSKAVEMIENNNSVDSSKPKKKVTRKALDASIGYRSRLPAKMIQTVTNNLEYLDEKLNNAKKDGENLILEMTPEDVELFREMYKNILPK
jgi:hypothetical protein